MSHFTTVHADHIKELAQASTTFNTINFGQ